MKRYRSVARRSRTARRNFRRRRLTYRRKPRLYRRIRHRAQHTSEMVRTHSCNLSYYNGSSNTFGGKQLADRTLQSAFADTGVLFPRMYYVTFNLQDILRYANQPEKVGYNTRVFTEYRLRKVRFALYPNFTQETPMINDVSSNTYNNPQLAGGPGTYMVTVISPHGYPAYDFTDSIQDYPDLLAGANYAKRHRMSRPIVRTLRPRALGYNASSDGSVANQNAMSKNQWFLTQMTNATGGKQWADHHGLVVAFPGTPTVIINYRMEITYWVQFRNRGI